MWRSIAAIFVVLVLNPAWLHAQSVLFTVNAQTAGIHQAPSADSPVIGQSTKGSVLDVRRNLGTWLEVSWPSAVNRVAYIDATAGSIYQQPGSPARPMTIAEFVATPASAIQAPPTGEGLFSTPGTSAPNSHAAQAMQQPAGHSSSITHMLGFGGRIGSTTRTIGPTGRVWTRKRIGVQFVMTRDNRTNAETQRITSMQFAPSVMYALPSAVGDYVWIRPYAGAGMTFYRSRLKSAAPESIEIGSDTDRRMHFMGGGEVTFASIPRLAVSADVGYYKAPAAFAGVEPNNMRLELSGHWFVK
jgi:hypothetical protein